MADIAQIQASSFLYPALQPVNSQPKQELSVQSQVEESASLESGKVQGLLDVSKSDEVGSLDSSQVEQFLVTLNEQLNQLKNTLQFEKDQDSERMLILVKDRTSGETIRQIPSEEFLAISKNITNFLESANKLDKTISIPPGTLTSEKA